MHTATWLAFVAAYAAMAITPGPVTLLVMSYALSSGRRTALAVVAGTTLGDATCCMLAAIGLGAIIAASATAFTALKLVGAAYLIFLGVRMWRTAARPASPAEAVLPRSALRMFGHAYLTTVLNPKTVLFFMVFLPQFLDPGRPLLPQLAVLLPTIFMVGGLVDGSYSFSAAMIRHKLRTPRAQVRMGRACGSLLVGEGIVAMGARLAG
jgi:threonine/homoserine/homoserine lactone efflux protein